MTFRSFACFSCERVLSFSRHVKQSEDYDAKNKSKCRSKHKTSQIHFEQVFTAINSNLRTARGLTEAETRVAAQAGLIAADQRWWWTEQWQKGERKAQRDIDAGRVSKVYDDVDEALRALKGGV